MFYGISPTGTQATICEQSFGVDHGPIQTKQAFWEHQFIEKWIPNWQSQPQTFQPVDSA
jgi:hypothetical protein